MLAIALLLISHGADLDIPVELNGPVTSMSDVCRQLSTATHVEIRPSTEVGREIVGVAVKGVSARELLSRLATAVDAEVVQTKTGWDVIRTEALSSARLEREVQNRAEMIRAAIKSTEERSGGLDTPMDDAKAKTLAAKVSTQWTRDDSGAKMDAYRELFVLGYQMPIQRFALRALKALPVDELAKLMPQQRLVFCLRPNRMQCALPASVVSSVKDLIAEQSVYMAAIRPYIKKDRDLGFYGFPTNINRPLPNSIEPVIFVRAENRNTWECQALGIGPTGALAFRSRLSVGVPRPTRELDPTPDNHKVTIDPEAFGVRTAIQAALDAQPVYPSPEVVSRVLRLTTEEPLDLYLGPIVRAIHAREGVNVIAVGDDLLFEGLQGFWSSQTEPLTLAKQIIGSSNREMIADGKWRIFRSKCPVSAANETVHRDKLGPFLAVCNKAGEITLDALSSLAIAHRDALALPLLKLLGRVAAPYTSSLSINGDLSLLRVYGMLSLSDRETLMSGKQVPGLLGRPALRKELENMIYSAPFMYHGSRDDEDYMRNGKDLGVERLSQLEVTYACPNGLPSSAELLLTSGGGGAQFEVKKIHTTGAWIEGASSAIPETIAWAIAESDDPASGLCPSQGMRFRSESVAYLNFRIQITPNLKLVPQLFDAHISHEPYMKLEELPRGVQDLIATSLEKLRAQRAAQRTAPPPP